MSPVGRPRWRIVQGAGAGEFDITHALLRGLIAIASFIAALEAIRYAVIAHMAGQARRLSFVLAGMLLIAGMLSASEAARMIIHPHTPSVWDNQNWLWLLGFDLLMPFWSVMLVGA